MSDHVRDHASHLGPRGPVAAANRWLNLVFVDHDLRQAWPLTDPKLRKQLATAWWDANRSHPALSGHDKEAFVAALSEVEPTHELWGGFALTQVQEIATTWAWLDLERFGWGGDTRIAGPNEEVVIFIETVPGGEVITEREARRGVSFLMRFREERWLVAGFPDYVDID